MDFIRLVLILFFVAPSISFAGYPPVLYFYDTYNSNLQTSRDAACASAVTKQAQNYASIPIVVTLKSCVASGDGAIVTMALDGGNPDITRNIQGLWQCFETSHVYSSGSIDKNSTGCSSTLPPPPPDCGSKIGDTSHSGEQLTGSGSHCPSSLCIGGCTYSRTGLCGIVGGTDWTALVGVGQGSSCAADNPPPASPCPVCDCLKAGKSWGTVNGVTVCVNAGSSGSNPVSLQPPPTTTTPASTTENPTPTPVTTQPSPIIISAGGASSGGSSGGNNAGSGSSAGSNGSGTVTTTNPDGSTTTEPMSNFCQQNPTAAICKEADKGSFGGSCGAFTCDGGDAVACAVALEQHNRNCEFFTKNDATLNTGNNIINGTDSAQSPVDHKTTVSLPNALDTSDALGVGGACFDDWVIPAPMGKTITVPMSATCTWLAALGYIFQAFSMLGAARIIGGAVNG